ncbi:hypothetical protein HY633_05150 [Candidatus Uhrbacteria bacterium]|nr:hypothetical protein [Candidatus Uhrbacteria bacterium]
MADQNRNDSMTAIARIEFHDSTSSGSYKFLTKSGGWTTLKDLIVRLRQELEQERLEAEFQELDYGRRKNRRAIVGEAAWIASIAAMAASLSLPMTWIGIAVGMAGSLFFGYWARKKKKLLPGHSPFYLGAIVDFAIDRSRLMTRLSANCKRIAELSSAHDAFAALDEAVREPLRRLIGAVVRYNEQVDLQDKALDLWMRQQLRRSGEGCWPVLAQVTEVLRAERPRLEAAIAAAERACVAVAVKDSFADSAEVISCLNELATCLDDFELSAQLRLDAHAEAVMPAGK